jgi:hypothetical protein
MFSSEDKKTIVVDGIGSEWYDKAIFVLKKDVIPSQIPKNLMIEAEKIVENHMKKRATGAYDSLSKKHDAPKIQAIRSKQKFSAYGYKDNQVNQILNWCLALSCILFVYCVWHFFW